MWREGVGFDILFWGRNEEIDVIMLKEYDFFFFNYNRNFLYFEIFGEGTNGWYTTTIFRFEFF